jgi:hypothetical protein
VSGAPIILIPVILVIGGVFGVVFCLDRRDERLLSSNITMQTYNKLSSTLSPIISQSEHRRQWLHHARQAVVIIATLLGILGGIDYFLGRPWPTDPAIHPLDFVSGTPLSHLFDVKNRSAFDMKNVEFTCGIDLVFFKDAEGQGAVISDMAFVNGNFSLPSGKSINYACDASNLVKVTPNGSLMMRHSMNTKPGVFRPPLSILKMCLWVRGKYEFLWKTWTFQSVIFKWPASQDDTQHWVEGPIAQEPPDPGAPNNTPDALECSPSVTFPYALFNGDGPPLLVFGN